jgi:hypothetical protein
MHFSIAPVEITSHMRHQFDSTASPRQSPASNRAGIRHRVSAMLHGIADRLEPTAADR